MTEFGRKLKAIEGRLKEAQSAKQTVNPIPLKPSETVMGVCRDCDLTHKVRRDGRPIHPYVTTLPEERKNFSTKGPARADAKFLWR